MWLIPDTCAFISVYPKVVSQLYRSMFLQFHIEIAYGTIQYLNFVVGLYYLLRLLNKFTYRFISMFFFLFQKCKFPFFSSKEISCFDRFKFWDYVTGVEIKISDTNPDIVKWCNFWTIYNCIGYYLIYLVLLQSVLR